MFESEIIQKLILENNFVSYFNYKLRKFTEGKYKKNFYIVFYLHNSEYKNTKICSTLQYSLVSNRDASQIKIKTIIFKLNDIFFSFHFTTYI